MTIKTAEDLQRLLQVGRIVGLTLQYMQDELRPGMTTGELDSLAEAFLRAHGARSAPGLTYGFPGATCISINEEVAHGIPGDRVINAGDLVKLDVSAECQGYVADAAVSVLVPPGAPNKQKLCRAAYSALMAAIETAQAGQPLSLMGRAAEGVAKQHGFRIVRELYAHGVGRRLHEAPTLIPQYYTPRATQQLWEGLVITVEPHLVAGSGRVRKGTNEWVITTADDSPVAVYEHTIIVTRDRPIIVTTV